MNLAEMSASRFTLMIVLNLSAPGTCKRAYTSIWLKKVSRDSVDSCIRLNGWHLIPIFLLIHSNLHNKHFLQDPFLARLNEQSQSQIAI